MSIPEKFIKLFPAYEDVFVGDLEHYRKHFLAICSINLQFLFLEQDERLDYVSVKEIHEGSVGEDTDGKYKSRKSN